jgi:hydrogenase maturation factor
MIKHIVLWKFKEQANGQKKAENLQKAASLLASLPAMIAQIDSFDVARNIDTSADAADLGLYSTFATLQDLRTYQAHPEHRRVAAFLEEVRSEKRVMDYEL